MLVQKLLDEVKKEYEAEENHEGAELAQSLSDNIAKGGPAALKALVRVLESQKALSDFADGKYEAFFAILTADAKDFVGRAISLLCFSVI